MHCPFQERPQSVCLTVKLSEENCLHEGQLMESLSVVHLWSTAAEETTHRQWHRRHRVPGGKHTVRSWHDPVQLPARLRGGAGGERLHRQCHLQGAFWGAWVLYKDLSLWQSKRVPLCDSLTPRQPAVFILRFQWQREMMYLFLAQPCLTLPFLKRSAVKQIPEGNVPSRSCIMNLLPLCYLLTVRARSSVNSFSQSWSMQSTLVTRLRSSPSWRWEDFFSLCVKLVTSVCGCGTDYCSNSTDKCVYSVNGFMCVCLCLHLFTSLLDNIHQRSFFLYIHSFIDSSIHQFNHPSIYFL